MASGFRRISDTILYTEKGHIASSLLMGFALAMLFRKVCNDRNCKVIVAPPLDHIESTTYELEGECYKYVPYPVKCPVTTTDNFIVPTVSGMSESIPE
jgi:hypothetical protein